MESDAYLLGTATPELQRLKLQNDLWSASTQQLWDRAGFSAGQSLLEMGCGPGFSTLALAERVGMAGQVLGWDRSSSFLEHLATCAAKNGMPWVQTLQGDVLPQLKPELRNSFDGVFTRWLLCWMKRPLDAIEAAYQALRPGGKFVVMDYFHYSSLELLPPTPAFRRGIQAVEKAWYAADGNPRIGSILPRLMTEAGFVVEHVHLNTRYATPGDPLWQWPMSFFPNFMRQLAEDGFLDAQEAEDFLAALVTRESHQDGLFLAPPMIELVAVKP
ncbi:MAG: methyltransferase domain-containing protein [Planctomycetota bacterium]